TVEDESQTTGIGGREKQSHPLQNKSTKGLTAENTAVSLVLHGCGLHVFCSKFYFSTHSIVPVLHSTFYPCHREPEGLERWVKPPSSLLHTMNDTQLFWRASFVPQIKEYPFNRTPKIAFMFLTRGELPLAPLWERFFAGNEGLYSIYIHSLPDYQANFSASSVFYRRQIPSQLPNFSTTVSTPNWFVHSNSQYVCDLKRSDMRSRSLKEENRKFEEKKMKKMGK
ncbi:unnamed protein product, partial [Thlaspi arvense]